MTEQEAPTTLNNVADLMDRRFTIPGTNFRFGVDSVIGLIPGIGDWAGGLIAIYFPVHAAVVKVPAPVIFRMFLNIIIDILIGSIPLLGDLFDVTWKANVRNVRLMQQYQHDPETTKTHSQWYIWSVVALFILVIILLLLFISWLLIRLFQI
jgi:hypothetical protein